MTQRRVVQESAGTDMGGGIAAVTVTTVDITDIQLGSRCEVCGAQFWYTRPHAKYCSGRCRSREWRARQKAQKDKLLKAIFEPELRDAQ